MWYRWDFMPKVPSLEDSSSWTAKRFTSIALGNLLSHRRNWIKKKMQELGIKTPKDAIEFGIKEVKYPLYMGKPDDLHVWNAYHGKNCFKVMKDYWDSCFDVMMEVVLCRRFKCTPLSDCEGSSIYIAGMLRILNVECYEVFGEVYRSDKRLGGHGWLIAKLEDNKWHLIESTLDTPPEYPDGYPVIDVDGNDWTVGNLRYHGWLRFTETIYEEWIEGDAKMNGGKRLDEYVKLTRKDKERWIKYKAIHEEWRIPTKPSVRRGLLSRLRWRK